MGLLVNATLASSAEAAALGLVTDELAAAHLDGACCLGKEVMSWLHAEHQATRRGRSVFPSKLVSGSCVCAGGEVVAEAASV